MENWLIDERMMKALVETLKEGNHSLVIAKPLTAENISSLQGQQKEETKNDGIEKHCILKFDGRGVSDLFRLLHEAPDVLEGSLLADKVVGKGAAALMALGKVKEVYADIISQPAFALLEQEGIQVSYGKLVPHIINRAGTGMCPVETRCQPCNTPAECLEEIKAFLAEMKEKKILEEMKEKQKG